jgi:hypothetical protein
MLYAFKVSGGDTRKVLRTHLLNSEGSSNTWRQLTSPTMRPTRCFIAMIRYGVGSSRARKSAIPPAPICLSSRYTATSDCTWP